MDTYTLEEAKRVWLISDTHFDHTNIIRYCSRPFKSVDEMNEVLLRNWRAAVAEGDIVYFLGDLTFGRESRGPRWWAKQLSGRIVWIRGSHDRGVRPTSIIDGIERVVLSEVISCGGFDFKLIHDTFDMNGWCGWVIHGHNHDNRPFIDNRFGHRRVNVSVEVIDYKPISLHTIVHSLMCLPDCDEG